MRIAGCSAGEVIDDDGDAGNDDTRPPAAPAFGEAVAWWFRLGCVSFGGPAGQIALMHRTRGGLAAGGLFVLPSLVLLIALSWGYMAFGRLPVVAGLLYGIKPAVTAIVAFAAWRLGMRVLRNGWLWGIAASAFAALFALNVPFPLVVLAAGVAGYWGGRLAPQKFVAGGHGAATRSYGPALIDDDTPPPAHARFSRGRFGRVLLAGIGLWAVAIGALAWAFGWNAVFTQMAWFFTKAALLTFGGAYAVLPYVVQGAVEQHGWLTAAQMIDGLALGETTPGPLIMVVAFVGFVGGWTKTPLGADALFLSGAAAAMVATFFTFLPSFVFILLGAPFVESSRGNLRLTGPLTAITAAVVGVIVNLAVFFAVHVLWPQGLAGEFEWPAAAIGALAAAALFRFKVGVIPVILGAGLLGLAARFVVG